MAVDPEKEARRAERERHLRWTSFTFTRVVPTALFVLIVVGVVAALSREFGYPVTGGISLESSKEDNAQMDCFMLHGAVELWRKHSGQRESPLDWQEVIRTSSRDEWPPRFSPPSVPIDPWGHPYLLNRLAKGKFEVRSAGPDGVGGTQDDIVFSKSVQELAKQVSKRSGAGGR